MKFIILSWSPSTCLRMNSAKVKNLVLH